MESVKPKTALEIICDNIGVYEPNAGIKALAKAAYDDPSGFCVMDGDNNCLTRSYREECPDRGACHRPDFMLACVATRNIDRNEFDSRSVDIYNNAMGENMNKCSVTSKLDTY